MKNWLTAAAVAGVLAWGGVLSLRAESWEKVDDAIQRGLPRSALTALDPILERALAAGDYPEAAKAIGWRIVLEGVIEGDRPEERIVRLEEELQEAPSALQPVFHTLLGHWYWQYFQQNRWRFMQRTMTAEPPGEDFTTWDLGRLFAEIDRQFSRALEAEGSLKATPIGEWDGLLEKGSLPDRYRPTLFDFLAHEALRFYSSGEQAGARPQDDFEIRVDSPIFAPAEEFLAWELPSGAADSAKAKAIALYQELLRFHRDDPDPTAFADVDLGRLVFGRNVAVGEGGTERFLDAVERFVTETAANEVAAMGLFEWAVTLQQQDDLGGAHALAKRALTDYESSPGAARAEDLIATIEAKSARIFAERVWNDPWPAVEVTYRNVDHIYLRAIPYDWERLLHAEGEPERLSREDRKGLLEHTPAAVWESALTPTDDFAERTEQIAGTPALAPGFYLVVASHDPEFRLEENQISVAAIWVSELALVVRPRSDRLEGWVVRAGSGDPVPGARVDLWELHYQAPRVRSRPQMTTDPDGFFSVEWEAGHDRHSRHGRYLLRAAHGEHQVASPAEHLFPPGGGPGARERAVLFTDRAIYRPGQAIQYKGILLAVDSSRNNYEVIQGRRVEVAFYDVNGEEIGRQQQQSNDYGSFSGSFTAPQDRLTGRMRIRVIGPSGATFFQVEEYKRPRFLVTLDPPARAPRLDEEVTVTGRALTYTGAAVDGGEISYRVVREVRWPWWWGYGRGAAHSPAQEIAHGTTRAGPDGSFAVTFTARPDLAILRENDPAFVYRLQVDVTDGAGETRSAERRVTAGYTALQAVLSAGTWQTTERPVEFTLKTRSLDGEAEAAEGRVVIYSLEYPEQVQRKPLGDRWGYWRQPEAHEDHPSNPESWPLGEVIAEETFSTAERGEAQMAFSLPAGVFRAVVRTADRFGEEVSGHLLVYVLDPAEAEFPVPVPHFFTTREQRVEPGERFTALWGTGYKTGRAFVELEHRGQIVESFWTDPLATQAVVAFDVTEQMRGGFHLHVTFVRENRAYTETARIDVPWSDRELQVRWEHFTSRLEPNQRETWTAVISGPDAEPVAAEMVATLYDASLEAFAPHGWARGFPFFYQDHTSARSVFANHRLQFEIHERDWDPSYRHWGLTYRSFPSEFVSYYGPFGRVRESARRAMPAAEMDTRAEAGERALFSYDAAPPPPSPPASPGAPAESGEPSLPDLGEITARRNLQETAFFFPHLTSDEEGVVRITFTMPEALTEWRFMGFAHDRGMRSGFFEGKTVTAKELMVEPNPPRFLREGDVIEFSVKVLNQTDDLQRGRVRLTFTDALLDRPADDLLGHTTPEQAFEIPAMESRAFSWRITVPDGLSVLTYRAVAASATVSDGEEGYLPVLSRRVLVRESLPLPIRGPGEREFVFEKLLQSGESDTLAHQGVTVQMVSNPAWYAVLALPYLMEFPYECTEQTFNRLYANSLARHIAHSDPKIRRVFDLWRNTPALDSPLEKNEELKGLLLRETPWVRQARSESEARRNVGVLFDDNRLDHEIGRAARQLAEAQLSDGSWPWFPGGPPNDFITLYITAGFGRLQHLGVEVPREAPLRALGRLDAWVTRIYRELGDNRDRNNLSPTIALYLYGRSFFLEDRPIDQEHRQAVDYFLHQAREYWVALGHRQSQGHLALALHRFGDRPTALAITDSLRERAVHDEEMGMFWRDLEFSWWWYRAPVETQALMIEVFAEVARDAEAVESCKVWLLKQKQTQDWKTTKATADAVYALLLRGTNLLASDELVRVTLGTGPAARDLTPERGAPPDRPEGRPGTDTVEPGTGFYEARFSGEEVTPEMGRITVRKADDGVAWGAIHWQYLEDVSKITPHEATPLKLRKEIFTKQRTARGPVLVPAADSLKVGDELVVRITLRSDRDMEYLHLKDQRGSGLEPLQVLSRYRYQDGLAYYESTRDSASHFFIDYLPKGTYVFEYSTRVFHRGVYESGIAEIQSMYAPEFSSHSESISLNVQ